MLDEQERKRHLHNPLRLTGLIVGLWPAGCQGNPGDTQGPEFASGGADQSTRAGILRFIMIPDKVWISQ